MNNYNPVFLANINKNMGRLSNAAKVLFYVGSGRRTSVTKTALSPLLYAALISFPLQGVRMILMC